MCSIYIDTAWCFKCRFSCFYVLNVIYKSIHAGIVQDEISNERENKNKLLGAKYE